MNQFNFVGNLTRDLELRTVKHGDNDIKVTTLSVALNSYSKNSDAVFVDVSVWGKSAENCVTYLKKGSMVRVTGRVRDNQYEKEGVKVYSYAFDADDVEFLSNPKKEE